MGFFRLGFFGRKNDGRMHEPLKLQPMIASEPLPHAEEDAQSCLYCLSDLNETNKSSDPTVCSECAGMTHFERELLYALHRVAEALEIRENDD